MEEIDKNRSDRRWTKTETAIKKAFFALASQGDFRKITITALAEAADIDRKTFYLHYHSIEDLMRAIAKDEARRMVSEIGASLPMDSGRIDPTRLTANLEQALRTRNEEVDADKARSAISHVPIDEFLSYLEEPLAEELLRIRGIENPADAQHIRYGVTFFVAGMLAVCKKWMHENPDESIEDISDYLKTELAYGSGNLLEIKNH